MELQLGDKFMFKLFGGSKKKGLEDLMQQAEALEQKGDLIKLSKVYYQIGICYQENRDLERARLYLERACTLYSNFDEVCDACESFMDDCDERLGALEEEPLLHNELLEQVQEKADEFSNEEKYYWGLLSLARFERIFKQLSDAPECEILDEIERVFDLLVRSMSEDMGEEDREYLDDFMSRFYEFGDSGAFVDVSNQVTLADGSTLQLFDLNGNDTLTCLHLFLDKCFSALSEGADWVEVGDEAEVDFIPCTLLLDYYLRNQEGSIRDNPKIRAEIARIWSDAEFIDTEPEREEILERLNTYRKLDILGEV